MAIQAPSKPRPPPPPTYMEAVEEIMRVYRSLPPRPTIEEVEAAVAVIKSADAEETARLEEVGRNEKAPELPEELFQLLQDVRRKAVSLQGWDLRREALAVVEMERRFREFDDLIQRASRLVGGDGGGEVEGRERGGFGMSAAAAAAGVERKGVDSLNDVRATIKEEEKKSSSLIDSKEVLRTHSLPPAPISDSDAEKLTLIKVASLFETSSKNKTGVLDLKGKLMDQIEWLPLSLGKLLDVTELDISENKLMALPSTIGNLKFLTKLDVHSNQVINLPDSFGELSNLTDLDLHSNRLKSVPATFGNLTSLVNLDLSSNQISVLPDSFGNLINLRRLNLETNELEELPYTIGGCSSLAELRLDFNELRALPEAIGKLQNLEILTAHYNRIKGLPTTMSSLTKLKELDISFNEIESIPESLCFVTSIVKLNAGNNFSDLRSLPRSLGNLEKLEELDISNNQIRVLPDSFRLLSKLRVLHVDETPLEVPPREVAKLGAQAVVQYMADLVEPKYQGSQPTENRSIWGWLCALFCPRCNNHKEDMDVV